jgi:hypothetical protein
VKSGPSERMDMERRLERTPSPQGDSSPASGGTRSQALEQRIQGPVDAPAQTDDVARAQTDDTQARIRDTSDTTMIGTPEQDAQFLHQQSAETCATVAQQGIIEKHTGVDYGEQALAQEAYEKGWTDRAGGTDSDKIGNLLESHGVPTQRWLDGSANMETLKDQLSQHHNVIVGVDAGEFYQSERIRGGHAVWVTGVETDSTGRATRVHVNDSNFAEPQVHDAETFESAWNNANRMMVAASRPGS